LRIKRSLVAVGALATATAMVALVAPMANAEPIGPNGKFIEPAPYDIVGVGSESLTALVGQLTFNYNKTVTAKQHSPADPWIFSWDAVPPSNLNDTTQQIVLKVGCKKNLRPNGSGAGILALQGGYGNTSYLVTLRNGKKKRITVPCIDFARSSRPRGSSDNPYAKNGDAFVTLAEDAVVYSSTKVTNVPSGLTLTQLQEIFGCNIPAGNGFPAGTWGALLGTKAKNPTASPDPILPQAGSGTLSFWAKTVLGIPTSEPTCGSASGLSVPNQPEENEGTSKVFLLSGKPNPNVIYPFSVGVYVAQEFNSRPCGHAPKKGQNMFGCAQNGVLFLDSSSVNGKIIAPTVPVAKGSKVLKTNPALNSTVYRRFLYDVVRFATNTKDHIPSYLEKFFGSKGFFCKQVKVMAAYGFETTPACGHTD
jgi:hypothetical protein